MVNLKNYNVVLKYFVLILTFIFFISCHQQKIYLTKIEGKEIGITSDLKDVPVIEEFIKPYRDKIDADLNIILAFAPETLDKTGQWQTPIGNFFADVMVQKGNKIFDLREKKTIDIGLFNSGGIRTIIPKGPITIRTAYEIMPFENNLVVIALQGNQVLEMIQYIITEKKPHPLNGVTFTISKNNEATSILIQGKPLEKDKIYYVATNDYLANGGDNMIFFKKGSQKFDLDYKLRNVLIDYFKEVDTVLAPTNKRITIE
jgi:2',3'-cyclic-nucleotide 2'-phosphodiesterase (5'-nucleotidase family)